VSELGDLLALMHGARGRIRTVRATVRIWNHVARTHEAMSRRGTVVMYGPEADEVERESVLRIWLQPPDLARQERDGEAYAVRRGTLWWSYDPHNGARTNEDRPESGGGGTGEEVQWLFDPAPLIGLLDYDGFARGQLAGRETISLRAVPRALADGEGWPLIRIAGEGADELRLEVDAELGALLRIEARLGGQPYALYETLEVAFGEAFADDVFAFTPPAGEELRAVGEESNIQHGLTIEQAVERAPFTVWIPAVLPADWETEIMFAAENDRPPMPPLIHLSYRARHGMHSINVTQLPADRVGEHDEYEPSRAGPWQPMEHNGRPMEIREPAETWQPAQLRVELGGTRILMHSNDLAAPALADLAADLVPAPAEPPDFGR
jgi:outer membrane lipoprotein-sorting protein